jgi:hypothetical protein
MYIKGEAPAHRTLIGRIITAPTPMISPGCILPPLASLRFHTRTEKLGARFKKVTSFFNFLKLRKSEIVSVEIA